MLYNQFLLKNSILSPRLLLSWTSFVSNSCVMISLVLYQTNLWKSSFFTFDKRLANVKQFLKKTYDKPNCFIHVSSIMVTENNKYLKKFKVLITFSRRLMFKTKFGFDVYSILENVHINEIMICDNFLCSLMLIIWNKAWRTQVLRYSNKAYREQK